MRGRTRPQAFSHAQTTARQRVVIEMLAQGAKAKAIAGKLGMTENGARKLMGRALKAQAAVLLSREAFEQAAALYLLWHDEMLQAWMPFAIGRVDGARIVPDKDAADVMLKLMKQFADVYGLTAPIKVQAVAGEHAGPSSERPQADLVALVMKHLDELADRQFPPVVRGEIEVQATPIPLPDEVHATSPE